MSYPVCLIQDFEMKEPNRRLSRKKETPFQPTKEEQMAHWAAIQQPSHRVLPCTLAAVFNGATVLPKCKRKQWKPRPVSCVASLCREASLLEQGCQTKAFAVPRRNAMAFILSGCLVSNISLPTVALAQQSVVFREYIDTFDGYSFKYPQNWIQVKGAGADVFFRDPYVLDENLSMEFSSPSSSRYKSVEDLGSPQEAGKKVLKQYLTEFMSTRLGVRRESTVISTSSNVADDGRMYYQVEVNIKSYANNNELAVMPQDRVVQLEWDRRYLSVLGVENSRLYELRLQTPENVFREEESDLRQVMDSFRVNKVAS